MKKGRVVVGLSGGVDSSVAALLLKEQGYEVIGLFMRNWNDASVTLEDECPWIDDSRDAMLVAEHLGIPFQVIDLSDQYKTRIVDYMFAEYESGRTPNPDILCNREIKFDIFLKAALKLGADYVATGHYVRKGEIREGDQVVYQLLSGRDPNKDQSYFLCQLNPYQLSKALFPIGELMKSEVRAIAAKAGLATAAKKDSQGLCFIGKVSLPDFLQQQLLPKEGDVIEIPRDWRDKEEVGFNDVTVQKMDLDQLVKKVKFQRADGKVIGKHQGAHYYTIGQRKGLNIGGKPLPLFVLQTDVNENVLYVGQGEDHEGLLGKGLHITSSQMHWVRPDKALQMGESRTVMSRIRYRQALQSAELVRMEAGYYLIFDERQKSITPGQFAAIYDGDELVASGVIE